MPKSKSRKLTPIKVAMEEAKTLLNPDGSLKMTRREIADKWHCSMQRVDYVMHKVRGPVKSAKASAGTANSVIRRRVPQIAAPRTSEFPVLRRIAEAMARVGGSIGDIQGHIAALPGFPPAERKQMEKKALAEVWGTFREALTNELGNISVLASGRKRRRRARKAAPPAKS